MKVDRAWIEGDVVICNQFGGEISFKRNEIDKIETSQRSQSALPRSNPKIKEAGTIEQKVDGPDGPSQKNIPEARSLALKAYQLAAENPFNAEARMEALEVLDQARQINALEAEIFLTEAIMVLQDGYRIGPWYKSNTYNAGTVDSAIYKVNGAINSDPSYYKSYAIQAWFYIIKSDFDKAEKLLDKSYSLESNNYYYWLYKGTLSMEEKRYSEASSCYDTANTFASTEGMKDIIRGRKKDLAKISGNIAEAERLYLDDISESPDSQYSYGNYAGFLLCNGRFEEAIEYYTKAINIAPYPAALIGLEFAKMKNNAAAKCKNNQMQI